MKVFHLLKAQFLPVSLQEAWSFFSSPHNLGKITPPEMRFEILEGADRPAYAGQLIRYKVRPLLGIPISWVTEISHCEAPHYFIDQQRFGPYKLWHHLHRFREVDGGVMMEDELHYGLYGGPLGSLLQAAFIGRKAESIFGYREKVLADLFPGSESPRPALERSIRLPDR